MSAQPSRLEVPQSAIQLACPRCRMAVGGDLNSKVIPPCRGCGFQMRWAEDVLEALQPDRARYFKPFVSDYELIRAAEGRGSLDKEHYLTLPYASAGTPNSAQWKIRAATFDGFVQHVLAAKTSQAILDLGAGNCWLSYRLAQRGHFPVAVDIVTNDTDGLGAAKHYRDSLARMFPCVRAELDSMPFVDKQFDIAVFNASFHYSCDYAVSFGEALRCVKPGGYIVILDSPWYAQESSGEQMVLEKRRTFQQKYGFPSDALPSQEFLTPERLHGLETRFNVVFHVVTPWYGWKWARRPWIAALKRRRVPAKFKIFTAQVPQR